MHTPTILSLLLTLAASLPTALAVPQPQPAQPQPDHRPPHPPHKNTGTIKCPLIFDGRIKTRTQLTDFDSSATSLFNPDNVKGSSLKWSQILKFPDPKDLVSGGGSGGGGAGGGGSKSGVNSRFDNCSHKPLEVTISDESVFKTQYGFRRAGLIFSGDTNTGSPASRGVKTLHFSVRQDGKRGLNLTHEYLNVWHETSDWSANQFNFQTGTIIGQEGLPKNTFKIMSRENKLIWSTPIEKKEWQNFAIALDFNKNTLQVYYSKGGEPLRSVTKAVPNNNAGEGQYQIGILKKPTGTDDVVNSGYQESGINEGQIYGGIFIEDSAGGCISL